MSLSSVNAKKLIDDGFEITTTCDHATIVSKSDYVYFVQRRDNVGKDFSKKGRILILDDSKSYRLSSHLDCVCKFKETFEDEIKERKLYLENFEVDKTPKKSRYVYFNKIDVFPTPKFVTV